MSAAAEDTTAAGASTVCRGAVARTLLVAPHRLPAALPPDRAIQTCEAAERTRGHEQQDHGLQSWPPPMLGLAPSVRPRCHAAPRHTATSPSAGPKDAEAYAGVVVTFTSTLGARDLDATAAGALRNASCHVSTAQGRIQAHALRTREPPPPSARGSEHVWCGLQGSAKGVRARGRHSGALLVTAWPFSARERPDVPMAKRPAAQ